MTPASLFISEDDLPFVEMGPGISYQLLEVDFEKGVWVTRMRFQPGVSIPPHKHTGEVLAFTVSGAWKYREYPDIYQTGSYVHEPEGASHTLEIPAENQGVTDILFINFGENINFDPDGKVDYIMDAKGILEKYLIQCQVEGHREPHVIGA